MGSRASRGVGRRYETVGTAVVTNNHEAVEVGRVAGGNATPAQRGRTALRTLLSSSISSTIRPRPVLSLIRRICV